MKLFGRSREDDVVDLTEHYRKQQEKEARMKAHAQEEARRPVNRFYPQLSESKQASAEQMVGRAETTPSSRATGSSSGGVFGGFFGGGASSSTESSSFTALGAQEPTHSDDSEERRRKLAKRLMEMTDKMEEMSNQIYHLQQRIEVLERRSQNPGMF